MAQIYRVKFYGQTEVFYFEEFSVIEKSLAITYSNVEDKAEIKEKNSFTWGIWVNDKRVGTIMLDSEDRFIHKKPTHF